jgi:transposase
MHDLHTRYKSVIHYLHFQKSLRRVSKIYNVSKSSLQRWVKQNPKYRKPRTRQQIRQDITTCIKRCIQENPFTTMRAMAHSVAVECGLIRSGRTMGRYMKCVGFTRKVASRRINYTHDNRLIETFCRSYIDACDDGVLVSVDEACFYMGDHPKRGWARRGERLSVMGGRSMRRSKFTLVMAVSSTGIVGYEVLEHNCKKPDFVRFIERLDTPPGSVILLDNVRFHHSKETIHAAQTKGFVLLHTPPYSPKMNPIENVFGMIKPEYKRACPPNFENGYDYRDLFEGTMRGRSDMNLSRFFEHVRTIAQETIDCIGENPEFEFCGYG